MLIVETVVISSGIAVLISGPLFIHEINEPELY
jgi:hypothetical protein